MKTPSNLDFTRAELFDHATSGVKLADYLTNLNTAGVLVSKLPEMAMLKSMPHRAQFHPESNTVWGHTLAALKTSTSIDPLANICTALHDLGKCAPERDETGRFTYRGHEHIGVAVMQDVQKRLQLFSAEELRAVMFCMENHMHSRLLMLREFPRPQILRLRSSPDWPFLVTVMHNDNACRTGLWQPDVFAGMLEWVDDIYGKWKALRSSSQNE